jgi:hypothetical protein
MNPFCQCVGGGQRVVTQDYRMAASSSNNPWASAKQTAINDFRISHALKGSIQ